jgi:diaminopropionate ammonia-lyase
MVVMNGILNVRSPVQIFENPRASRAAEYAANGRREILSLAAFEEAKREIISWTGYVPTPLRHLNKLAARAGVTDILYKDEAGRFGIDSFKAIGGGYAVCKLLRQAVHERTKIMASSADLVSGRYDDITRAITVTCATDGNHGRAVAWGAQTFRCRCVVYVHEAVSEGRCRAIAKYGAEVRRVPGTFDDAVRRAASDAATHGWFVVSDTSYEGYTDIPRDVMQGYSLMADEALEQNPAPSHIFLQGGVGGLAAGQCAYFWERLGAARPRFVVVEPDKADCLYRSAVAGKPVTAPGPLDTVMAGLACGEVSLLAWQILQVGADDFMTIADDAAIDCIRLLAEGRYGDPPIVAGESAVAGLAGFLLASADPKLRRDLALGSDSRILVFGTEGATDPELYTRLVGRTPEQIAHRVEVE